MNTYKKIITTPTGWCIMYIKRYKCGHYSLRIVCGGSFETDSIYNRLTRFQIEKLCAVSCKEVFGLKH